MGFSDGGGPRLGAGHPPKGRDWVREERVAVLLTVGQKRELEEIAKAWNVPVGTAIWALVEEALAKARRAAPRYGLSKPLAAAVVLLRIEIGAQITYGVRAALEALELEASGNTTR